MKKLYLKIKDGLCGISSDKYLHFIMCMILTQILVFALDSFAVAVVGVMGIGILKELFDKFVMKEDFDTKDLVADSYGVLVGLVVLILINNIAKW